MFRIRKTLTKTIKATAVGRYPPLTRHVAHAASETISTSPTNFKAQPQLKNNSFDPKRHVAFTPPSKAFSMSNIEQEDSPLSSFAVSEPFRLFSPEAVERMREEIFQPQVQKYQVSSNLSSNTRAERDEQADDQEPVTGSLADTAEKAKPIVDWHTDSYPFVVVTMLSDCTDMAGGETVLRKGDGDTLKLRGPQMGYSVLLQGRYIEHKGLRAYGSTERITAVTSFRPKNYALPDETVLTTVRPVSDLDQLYAQYARYRFEMLQKRLEDQIKAIRQAGGFDVQAVKAFLKESVEFLAHTDTQIVEKELVKEGEIDNSILPSEKEVQAEK